MPRRPQANLIGSLPVIERARNGTYMIKRVHGLRDDEPKASVATLLYGENELQRFMAR